MLGRAASLQAGRKENRWPTGGRGSRVGPHSGLDPKLLSGPRPLDFINRTVRHSLCSALNTLSLNFRIISLTF